LSQITDAHKHYKGFGQTGEFTLARREGDNIVFLLRHRHYDLDKPKPIALDSKLAEPMRRALSGLSGTVVGLDYRGVTVLAAYEPVTELGLGIVAKIDLVEVRAPFVKAGIIAIGAALLVVLAGATFFLRVSNPIIRDLQNRTAELTVANEQLQREILERKKAEERLRFQAQLLSSVRESVVATDLEGHVIYWGRGAEKLYGYNAKEVMGKPITFIVEPHEEEEEEERMRQVFETGSWSGEYMQQCKDGSKFWADTVISLVTDKNEQPSGFIGIDRDITEREQAKEALRRAHDELELRVEERTAELIRANEKLSRSEEELRLLSSQLLTAQEDERARIACDLHDSIGQYLNVIKLKIGESLRHLNNGMFELAGESCKITATAIQDVLDEVRRIYMELRPSLLDDLGILVTIDWFCREFQEMYPEISLEKELSVEEREVPESLKIVIYRLLQEALNNIAKHSKADRVLVTVRRKDNTLELAIEDNGRGFDLEEVLSVESTKRGLGLGTMRERTGLSGGSFSIETAKGAGTVVRASWQSQELESAKL
jgi:PAS domain S-box-containing protein